MENKGKINDLAFNFFKKSDLRHFVNVVHASTVDIYSYLPTLPYFRKRTTIMHYICCWPAEVHFCTLIFEQVYPT